MVILGDARMLCEMDPFWHTMISFCHRHGCLQSDRPETLALSSVALSRLERGVLQEQAIFDSSENAVGDKLEEELYV